MVFYPQCQFQGTLSIPWPSGEPNHVVSHVTVSYSKYQLSVKRLREEKSDSEEGECAVTPM